MAVYTGLAKVCISKYVETIYHNAAAEAVLGIRYQSTRVDHRWYVSASGAITCSPTGCQPHREQGTVLAL